jgi:hypothetical protein
VFDLRFGDLFSFWAGLAVIYKSETIQFR